MEILNQKIVDCMKLQETFAVATIMADKGSTPRTSGSKMIVLKDRTIYGTIGGGIVEAKVIDSCLELIEQKKCKIVEFSLNNQIREGIDMICGGSLTFLIETFSPDLALISLFEGVVQLERKGKRAIIISKIEGISKSDFTTQKWLYLPDGTLIQTYPDSIFPLQISNLIGNSRFSDSSFAISSQISSSLSHPISSLLSSQIFSPIFSPIIYNSGSEEFIVEQIQIQDKMYIFGAGHVGLELAKIAYLTDFKTIITDDRKEFANNQRFPDAKAVRVVDHFTSAFDDLSDELLIDNNSYIVILTRGHLHDQTVLEAALKTDAAYIGMIGSRAKRDKIYSNLEKKGVARERLNSVYSPIGLDIHSETPAEIAVSIIGQIIKVRAERGLTYRLK